MAGEYGSLLGTSVDDREHGSNCVVTLRGGIGSVDVNNDPNPAVSTVFAGVLYESQFAFCARQGLERLPGKDSCPNLGCP